MARKITLVEDDIDAAVVLEKILLKAGYAVNVLPEGRAIVETGYQYPDMFILDNYMPTIHGIALCKYLKLKPETSKIPIIIISGEPLVGKKAVAAGASSFLSKPFDADKLIAEVQLLFENHPE